VFYYLFSFLFDFLSPFVFSLFFTLVLYLFFSHVVLSLTYTTCLGIKGLIVVVDDEVISDVYILHVKRIEGI
jgi:hypothetical protein